MQFQCALSLKQRRLPFATLNFPIMFLITKFNLLNFSYFQFDCWLEDRETVLCVLVYFPGYETV
jgi:hypothetical protein